MTLANFVELLLSIIGFSRASALIDSFTEKRDHSSFRNLALNDIVTCGKLKQTVPLAFQQEQA